MFEILKQLDIHQTQKTTFASFKQACRDNNIEFAPEVEDYLLKYKCDKNGCLKYPNVIKDLMVKTFVDPITGKLQSQWMMHQLFQRQKII